MQDKINKTGALLLEAASSGIPALLCSFGKDSMVLLHMIRELMPRASGIHARPYPMPIIFWRMPWFPQKYAFANKVINDWGLEVNDWFPAVAGIKVKDDSLELVSRYSLGNGNYMDTPANTLPPEEYAFRHDYICGLQDWLLRPKCELTSIQYDVLIHGHKSSDTDPFDGSIPLKDDKVKMNERLNLFFPLRDWTDANVWQYLETNHVPYQKTRYEDRQEISDKWLNPDYTHACTRCIDPRNESEVMCPKLDKMLPNISNRVVRLQQVPDYIEKE